MQAIQINAYGDPKVLQILDLPKPKLNKYEVLIKIKCIVLNNIREKGQLKKPTLIYNA